MTLPQACSKSWSASLSTWLWALNVAPLPNYLQNILIGNIFTGLCSFLETFFVGILGFTTRKGTGGGGVPVEGHLKNLIS